MNGEEERCIAVGCNDYVRKPVTPSVLIDACVSAIRKAKGVKKASAVGGAGCGGLGPLLERVLERLPIWAAALKEAQSKGDLSEAARCGHQMRGAVSM